MCISRMEATGRSERPMVLIKIRNISADQTLINVETSKLILQVGSVEWSKKSDSTDPTKEHVY